MSEDLEPTRLPDGEIRMMSQVRQAPTLGRIVVFHTDFRRINGTNEFVAVIGQVFNDPGNPRPYCNLLVMPPFEAPYWEGSVQEFDPEAPDVGRSWRFPPRT